MRKVRELGGEEGFSLLELLIVAVIIGILVGIAVFSFALSVSTSKMAACKSNLKIVRNQMIVYYVKNDSRPPSLGDLVPGYIEDGDDLHCPETGDEYIYDAGSGEVSCPYHTDP